MSDLFTANHNKSRQAKPNLADSSDEELARHWTLSEIDRRLINECRGEDNKRRFALQLCTLRAHGRFLADYEAAPIRMLNHLSAQLGLDPRVNA
jgi:TnpA family transposase